MPKKIPMRRCTGCGEMKEKKSLIRIVRTPEGEIRKRSIPVQRSFLSAQGAKKEIHSKIAGYACTRRDPRRTGAELGGAFRWIDCCHC